ncbi:MAG: hypothetical protein IKC40_05250, partial [Oscillospiraceae bacterium]|nr:hypothetical protein [Oscillospiraceae bacterium]
MSKMKRTLALLATLAMASTAFVACGPAEESKPESKPESKTESKTEESKTEESKAEGGDVKLADDGDCLTIVCWTDTDLNNMFDVYTEKNTDAKVGENI